MTLAADGGGRGGGGGDGGIGGDGCVLTVAALTAAAAAAMVRRGNKQLVVEYGFTELVLVGVGLRAQPQGVV